MERKHSARSAKHLVVPARYAGRWIAWGKGGKAILASGFDIASVVAAARRKGEPRPILEKVPRGFFVG